MRVTLYKAKSQQRPGSLLHIIRLCLKKEKTTVDEESPFKNLVLSLTIHTNRHLYDTF